MKKLLCFVLAISMLLLGGCSSDGEQSNLQSAEERLGAESEPTISEHQKEIDGQVSIDGGLSEIELTIPADLLGGNISEELTEEDRADGYKSARINDDGSITYVISRNGYNQLVKNYKEETIESLSKLPDEYESISEIKINDDLTEISLIVDRKGYENGYDDFAITVIFFSIAYYKAFLGIPDEDIDLVVNIQDVDTMEIFDTCIYPDDMEF